MASEDKNTIGEKMIAEACKAYGIDKKFVFNSRYDEATETAIVVTHGGKKVSYKAGDKVEPLGQIAVTGINPEKRKPITGGKK